MPNDSQHNPSDLSIYQNQALALLNQEKTMVLAVNMDDTPWVAPVYYVFVPPGIYFFSSPRSKHIQAISRCGQAAGAVYAQGRKWEEIQGLQMTGRVDERHGKREALKITTHFLVKFPFARQLMSGGVSQIKNLAEKVRLYVFLPTEIHCTDNRLGFGRRVRIEI